MIQIEGLRKHFGEVKAVGDIDFTAADGAVTGLLGPNGAGKTTTLRMLYGLMQPDGSRMLIEGADVGIDPQTAQARRAYYPTPEDCIRASPRASTCATSAASREWRAHNSKRVSGNCSTCSIWTR